MAITHRWLVIFVLALTCQSSDSADPVPAVMCATGTFTAGTRAFVTCFFNRDISVGHKYNFNVVQYTSSGASSGNHVVLCNWRADNDKECKVSDGYSYNEAVTDQLTVEIPEVSRSHAGLYACQILPADDIPVKTCDLNVTEPKATIPPPTVTTQPDETSKDDGSATITALAILLAIFVIIAIIAVWALVMLFLQSRRRKETPADFFRSLLPCLKNGVKKRNPVQPDDDASTTVVNRRSMAEMTEMANLLDMDRLDSVSVAPTMLTSANGKQNLSDRQTQTPRCEKFNTGTQTLQKEQLPVKEWTEGHVREWLMEQKVATYQPLIDKRVNGAQLLLLNHESLLKKDMDMKKPKQADKLKDRINKLIEEDKARQEKWATEQAERDRQAAQQRDRDHRIPEQRERDQKGHQEERGGPAVGGESSNKGGRRSRGKEQDV